MPFARIPLHDHGGLFRLAERAGYDDLWSGESHGSDAFTPLALAATCTEHVRLGTGIVNPFTRGPAVIAQHAAALADASRGRFVLGLGTSTRRIVEEWNGTPYTTPMSKLRNTVDMLRTVLAGETCPRGFALDLPPAHDIPIVLAALRPRMLGLAAEIADGAFTHLLPLRDAATVARSFGAPHKELLCRFICIPDSEGDGFSTARFLFATYASVPAYAAFLRWLGWGERIDPMVDAWRAGEHGRALELVPRELVREIFILGSTDEMRARLEQFRAEGISTLVLAPVCRPAAIAPLIEKLAPRR